MWISPQITRGHLWKCSRIVPGAVLSIESKNGVRISKNKKCNFFAFYQNLESIQTQAQDALNLLQSKSLLNRKVSVKSGDTGNSKFVQNYNREKILEKSLFWVEEPGCSSRTQKPAHQSADFSTKKGVTPGGNDLELFLGQSWVSSQKMGSVSQKTKNAIFLHFIKIRKITKGSPLGIKKIQSKKSLFWTKSSLLRRKPPKVEVFQVLTKNLIKKKKKNSQSGGFSSFRNQKWRILFQNRQKV